MSRQPTTDTQPFAAPEYERALLGCVLRDADTIGEVDDVVTAADFRAPHNAALWTMLRDRWSAGEPMDDHSVATAILRAGDDSVGGLDYVMRLSSEVPSTAAARHYAQGIAEAAQRRRALRKLDELRASLCDGNVELDEVEGQMATLADVAGGTHDDDIVSLGDAAASMLDEALAASRGERVAGVPVCLEPWAEYVPELGIGQLHLVGALPGRGKSALALQQAIASARAGYGVGIFPLEMRPEEQASRALAGAWRHGQGHTPTSRQILRGEGLMPPEWERIQDTSESFDDLPVMMDRRRGLTARQIIARARRMDRMMQARWGVPLRVVVVDGLRQVVPEDRRAQLAEQVADTVYSWKNANLDVSWLVAVHFGREGTKHGRPKASHIYGGQSTYDAADSIAILHRDEDALPELSGLMRLDLHIDKNRSGETGATTVFFDGRRMRFHATEDP